jgi:hypothetical protein
MFAAVRAPVGSLPGIAAQILHHLFADRILPIERYRLFGTEFRFFVACIIPRCVHGNAPLNEHLDDRRANAT